MTGVGTWAVQSPDGRVHIVAPSKSLAIDRYLSLIPDAEITNGRESWHWLRRKHGLRVVKLAPPTGDPF